MGASRSSKDVLIHTLFFFYPVYGEALLGYQALWDCVVSCD